MLEFLAALAVLGFAALIYFTRSTLPPFEMRIIYLQVGLPAAVLLIVMVFASAAGDDVDLAQGLITGCALFGLFYLAAFVRYRFVLPRFPSLRRMDNFAKRTFPLSILNPESRAPGGRHARRLVPARATSKRRGRRGR